MDRKWLQNLKIFGELKAYEWEELFKIAEEKSFNEGDIIFNQGDESTELYILVKGAVDLQIRIAPQLADSTVYTVNQNELFGEFAFIDPNPRSATARCTKNSEVVVIKKQNFEELIKGFPDIGLNFYRFITKVLSDKVRRMNNYVRDIFIRSCGIET